ncbi:MAG: hypothetical protein EKK61_02015 [Rickettsiales bacterium]|nr:MAG: hypothetical protein EKK61_02015 [Rickettsiales bacterium]
MIPDIDKKYYDLPKESVAQLNTKIEESLDKIAKIARNNDSLIQLKKKHFGKTNEEKNQVLNLSASKKIKKFQAFKKEGNQVLSNLLADKKTIDIKPKQYKKTAVDANKKGIKDYKYIEAIASSIDIKHDQLALKNCLANEKFETPERKTHIENLLKLNEKREQILNKEIKKFEIKSEPVKHAKQAAKEVGKSLKQKLANIVPSPIKEAANKIRGRG